MGKSFWLAGICCPRGLLISCSSEKDLQSTFFARKTFMQRPIRVNKTIGATQEGFRAMSSKVLFGENRTPLIRPNEPIVPCASATVAGFVAIEHTSTPTLRSPFPSQDL